MESVVEINAEQKKVRDFQSPEAERLKKMRLNKKKHDLETDVERIIGELKKARDAQEPEKSRQLALGFEKLGDYFVERSKTQKDHLLSCHRAALKAISLYNLGLASAQLGDDKALKKLLKKLLATENSIIKRSGGRPVHQNVRSYKQEIEDWKKKITRHSRRS